MTSDGEEFEDFREDFRGLPLTRRTGVEVVRGTAEIEERRGGGKTEITGEAAEGKGTEEVCLSSSSSSELS